MGTALSSKKKKLGPKDQEWVEARKRHKLSNAHIQMARELGMAPGSLRKLDNHKEASWKLPLPQYLDELYEKRFGRTRPLEVLSVEQFAKRRAERKAASSAARRARRDAVAAQAEAGAPGECRARGVGLAPSGRDFPEKMEN